MGEDKVIAIAIETSDYGLLPGFAATNLLVQRE